MLARPGRLTRPLTPDILLNLGFGDSAGPRGRVARWRVSCALETRDARGRLRAHGTAAARRGCGASPSAPASPPPPVADLMPGLRPGSRRPRNLRAAMRASWPRWRALDRRCRAPPRRRRPVRGRRHLVARGRASILRQREARRVPARSTDGCARSTGCPGSGPDFAYLAARPAIRRRRRGVRAWRRGDRHRPGLSREAAALSARRCACSPSRSRSTPLRKPALRSHLAGHHCGRRGGPRCCSPQLE